MLEQSCGHHPSQAASHRTWLIWFAGCTPSPKGLVVPQSLDQFPWLDNLCQWDRVWTLFPNLQVSLSCRWQCWTSRTSSCPYWCDSSIVPLGILLHGYWCQYTWLLHQAMLSPSQTLKDPLLVPALLPLILQELLLRTTSLRLVSSPVLGVFVVLRSLSFVPQSSHLLLQSESLLLWACCQMLPVPFSLLLGHYFRFCLCSILLFGATFSGLVFSYLPADQNSEWHSRHNANIDALSIKQHGHFRFGYPNTPDFVGLW